MKILFIVITSIIVLNFILNIVNYYSAKKCFKNKNKKLIRDDSNIYILLPVYKEEKIASIMIDRFNKLSKETKVKVIIIATKKEKDNKTYNIINKKIKKEGIKNIILIKCDKDNGTMATQLNYGIKYIKKIDKSNFIIGVYNADSLITPEHINFVRNNISNKRCIQSYSYFDYSKNILLNNAISWQNRWSYIFEAGRCNFKLNKNFIFKNMNYVIGHGLYLKKEVIKEVGYFPEDTINEDAFLGVLLNYKNYDLIPMPFLEKADFAPSIKIYIKQQSVWFNGPKMAFDYYLRIIKNINNKEFKRNIFKNTLLNHIKLLTICFKLFLHSIYWIGAVYLLFILYGIICFKLFGIYSLIFVYFINYINIVLFNYLSFKEIKKETNSNNKFPIINFPITFYFIHSFGPIVNVIKSMVGKNTINNKYKTER